MTYACQHKAQEQSFLPRPILTECRIAEQHVRIRRCCGCDDWKQRLQETNHRRGRRPCCDPRYQEESADRAHSRMPPSLRRQTKGDCPSYHWHQAGRHGGPFLAIQATRRLLARWNPPSALREANCPLIVGDLIYRREPFSGQYRPKP